MSGNSLPLIVEPERLQAMLPDDDLLLVAVCSPQVFNSVHIPGSRLVRPAELVSGVPPATGKIPDEQRLSALFSRIGLHADRHVVAYDDEGGGWAGRLIWTLDVLGHGKSSWLNGGLVAWSRAGYACSTEAGQPAATAYTARIDHHQTVTLAELVQHLGAAQSVIWDARAKEEYDGTRVTALRNGHIPGAVNLDWLELLDRSRNLRLKPLEDIRRSLESLGITRDKPVITHCQTHHRSGLSYVVGKALGFDIRAYDGSWAEWGNAPHTPVETTASAGGS